MVRYIRISSLPMFMLLRVRNGKVKLQDNSEVNNSVE